MYIETKGFLIGSPGDPNVGIPSAGWEVKGPFIFNSQEEFDGFKKGLEELFESYVADDAMVGTIEENEKWLQEG